MAKRPSKSERRRRILEAARAVFSRRGFSAARMVDVAAQAGVGKGTLYEYFRSKEELFSTLVLVVARESLDALPYRGTSDDPAVALRESIAYVVEVALGEHLDLYRLFFDFWGVATHHRMDAQVHLREVAATFGRHVGEILRRGQRSGAFRAELDPEQYVRALSAAIDGLSLRIVVLGETVDLVAYARCLQDVFVTGIEAADRLRGASVLREKDG